MITYQELYDMLRKEKYNEELQPLPRNFLDQIAAYIQEKKSILTRQDKSKSLFLDTLNMTRKQLDNTIAIIKELTTIRQRKILNMALAAAMTGISKRDIENLLHYETELFELTARQLERCHKEIAEKLEGKGKKEQQLKHLLIRFREEVPAFLDAEGNELGPFKQGDVANLPTQIASILVTDGKAAPIEE